MPELSASRGCGSTEGVGGTVLLDCRWLGVGGAGRATELLLRGLQEIRPTGEWLLWGPDGVRDYLWEGANHQQTRASPNAMLGQRALSAPAPHDVALYLHQMRPLRPGPSITFIHDTIPLRLGGSSVSRRLKRLFLKKVAALSAHILTASAFSKACIERDLHVPSRKISVVPYPVDTALVQRVAALRESRPSQEVALYVGRLAAHKNLERLIAAFGRTRFCNHGGTLLLVGAPSHEAERLRRVATASRVDRVAIEPPCSQARLDELYATSRLLVLPSLEEGFGLPAWEALCCSLPVCVSDGGSLPEITSGLAEVFPAHSIAEMAAAIDRAAGRRPGVRSRSAAPRGSSINHFAAEVVRLLAAQLARQTTALSCPEKD